MSKKPSQAQQEVLEQLKHGIQAIYSYYGEYWFLTTPHQRRKCTRQIEALIKLGLVKVVGTEAVIVVQENENA